jgi:hypothetical protein
MTTRKADIDKLLKDFSEAVKKVVSATGTVVLDTSENGMSAVFKLETPNFTAHYKNEKYTSWIAHDYMTDADHPAVGFKSAHHSESLSIKWGNSDKWEENNSFHASHIIEVNSDRYVLKEGAYIYQDSPPVGFPKEWTAFLGKMPVKLMQEFVKQQSGAAQPQAQKAAAPKAKTKRPAAG